MDSNQTPRFDLAFCLKQERACRRYAAEAAEAARSEARWATLAAAPDDRRRHERRAAFWWDRSADWSKSARQWAARLRLARARLQALCRRGPKIGAFQGGDCVWPAPRRFTGNSDRWTLMN